MATISSTAYIVGGSTGVPAGQSQSTVTYLDMPDLLADFAAAGGVTTNSLKVMTIPANTMVEVLQVEVINGNISLGAGAALSVGYTGATTAFVNAASTTTEGTDLTIALIPKLFTSADNLLVTITGGTIATTGGLRFVLRLTDLSRVAPAVANVYTHS